jgi:hypothetical protein
MDYDSLITPDDDAPVTPSDPGTGQEPTESQEFGGLIDNDEPAETPAEPDNSDGDAGQADDTDGVAESAGAETPEPGHTDTVPEPSEPVASQPVAAVADPGDFVPQGDYAFDITLADGTTVHIAKPEDIDQLPQDADFGTPANLMKAQAALNKMMTGHDQEKREY